MTHPMYNFFFTGKLLTPIIFSRYLSLVPSENPKRHFPYFSELFIYLELEHAVKLRVFLLLSENTKILKKLFMSQYFTIVVEGRGSIFSKK